MLGIGYVISLWLSLGLPYTYLLSCMCISTYLTGESNAGNYDLYSCQFPAMISDWRQKFHNGSEGETSDQFPFGFVQVRALFVNGCSIMGFMLQ